MIRCVLCGCSRLDSQGVGCARCGGSPAVRWEEVHVDEQTKAKLLAHSNDLRRFGVTLRKYRPVKKDAGLVLASVALALQIADSLRSGVLHDLVLYLRNLDIPEEQIIRLRLDEPENISKIVAEQRHEGKRAAKHKST